MEETPASGTRQRRRRLYGRDAGHQHSGLLFPAIQLAFEQRSRMAGNHPCTIRSVDLGRGIMGQRFVLSAKDPDRHRFGGAGAGGNSLRRNDVEDLSCTDKVEIPRYHWLAPDHQLGERTYALRQVYERLKSELPGNALVQQNPNGVPGDLFYGLYADRQTAAETSSCGVAFGGAGRALSRHHETHRWPVRSGRQHGFPIRWISFAKSYRYLRWW